MKQLLYFLFGFLLPFIFFLPFVLAECLDTSTFESQFDTVSPGKYYDNSSLAIAARSSFYASLDNTVYTYGSWIYTGNSYVSGVRIGWISAYKQLLVPSGSPKEAQIFYYFFNGPVEICDNTPDADGDGIPDDFDLYPDDSSLYKAGIVSVCYDQNNKVVAGIIQDDKGNQYSFGTMPTNFEGYTIESVTGDLITYQTGEDLATSLQKLDINDLNIIKKNEPVEIQDSGTFIPGSTNPFKDYRNAEDNQTKAPTPTVQPTSSEQPNSNDVDSDRFDKIIKNTSATNTNLDNIQKYLGVSNDLLAKINENIKNVESGVDAVKFGGGALSVGSETGTIPTADEIGQAVNDKLIDSGQTIDTTITDNLASLDKTDTLTSVKTKYSDRYDLFIATLKGSDLFSLPFGIFTGPSGSGSSIQTVNIGKWGLSTDQTATIDYSNYDSIWNILRSVLLLLTSFSCFKIFVLKKG
ncbi:hypothetical protein [Desulfobacter sp. UBA2225]|uniref:hypothetical protein n=1 Tax=Desulfobacter sp. UBA2225 TaxID=1961413 RepID=UPI00257F81F4|nr:hypothetical protein [Desulfobacter sp. UBA2225]